jgi:hypothetical protein
MKVLLACTVLLLSTVLSTAALAQVADGQTGTAGETGSLRRGNRRTHFEGLPRILRVGQEVKVRDESGRTTRGKCVSISENELVVAGRQYPFPQFRSRKERVFAKDVVRRIDIVDSTWNGAAIGAAVGAAFLVPRPGMIGYQIAISGPCTSTPSSRWGSPRALGLAA